MKKFPVEFVNAVFGRKSKYVHEMLAATQRKNRDTFFADGGYAFTYGINEKEIVEGASNCIGRGSTRAIFHFVDDNDKTRFRFDVPTRFFKVRQKFSFWLYNIRFMVDFDRFPAETESMLPFRTGYYGITKRDVFQRYSEHERDMRNGQGHLLHTAWRALHHSGVPYFPVLQVSGIAKTLDEIYSMEEEAVEKLSLTPRGLNAIPGGYAGIKMLHQLALLSDIRVSPGVRDGALCQIERGKVATHYRSGHMRKLSNDRLIWINPCWVNLAKELAV